ncbi:hypothetical protein EDB92DRAFT_1769329, partial [Lactarius akahatsu]
GERIVDIPLDNGLYRLPMPAHVATASSGGELVMHIDELHRRLGHVGIEACRDAVQSGMVEGVWLVNTTAPAGLCKPCERAKASKKSFLKESATPRATEYSGRVHSDVWGPAQVQSIGKREYMLTLTDE